MSRSAWCSNRLKAGASAGAGIPASSFELERVQHWLSRVPWRRAKLVLHSNAGWQSANALHGQALQWRRSEWRKDSRLELIFSEAQDIAALQAGFGGCRIA